MTTDTGDVGRVLSIREVANILGVSDDLAYELVARGEIPCLRLGRRRLIPRRVVDLMIERSVETFDAGAMTIPVRRGTGETD
jgi:excisionase family DNA binding protein